MSDTEIDHMLCRYSRRAQFLRDRDLPPPRTATTRAPKLALLALCNDDSGAAFPDLAG